MRAKAAELASLKQSSPPTRIRDRGAASPAGAFEMAPCDGAGRNVKKGEENRRMDPRRLTGSPIRSGTSVEDDRKGLASKPCGRKPRLASKPCGRKPRPTGVLIKWIFGLNLGTASLIVALIKLL